MADPTNTLILTGFTEDEIHDAEILRALQEQILANTPASETIKFSVLKSFKRILIVFERIESSATLHQVLRHCGFRVGFSSQNNYDDYIWTDDGYKFDTREYLRLPPHGTTFIISPPPSPPPGWKSFTEGAPEPRSIYSPQELGELLYKKVGDGKIQRLFSEDDDSGSSGDSCAEEAEHQAQKKKNSASENRPVDQKVVLQGSTMSSPIIVLEAPENEELELAGHGLKKPAKVSLPPTAVRN